MARGGARGGPHALCAVLNIIAVSPYAVTIASFVFWRCPSFAEVLRSACTPFSREENSARRATSAFSSRSVARDFSAFTADECWACARGVCVWGGAAR